MSTIKTNCLKNLYLIATLKNIYLFFKNLIIYFCAYRTYTGCPKSMGPLYTTVELRVVDQTNVEI